MSKFLAPIHNWLFNKIKINEAIENEVLNLLEENEGTNLKTQAIKNYGEYSKNLPLEDQIDTGNIHGWLQDHISKSETRLSFILKHLLDNNVEINKINEVFYSYGKQIGEGYKGNIAEDSNSIYKFINDTVLDGMPCDMVNKILEQDDNSFTYVQTKNIHESYAIKVGLDPETYLSLRDEFIKGLLSSLNYNLNITDISPRTYKASKLL